MTRQEVSLKDMNIEHLVVSAQQGNKKDLSELLVQLSPLVHYQAKGFQNSGVELDDLCQEGMLGVLQAVSSFKEGCGANFRTYAGVCVKNRLLSVIRKRSGKSVFSDETVSIDNDECDISSDFSIEEQFIGKDEYDKLFEYINSILSHKEQETLRLFLSGLSYDEISQRTGSSSKSVDNALQRVRQKLKKYNS